MLLDVDGSGTVDYEEFVLSVTSYCMFTRDEVLKCKKVFIFSIIQNMMIL